MFLVKCLSSSVSGTVDIGVSDCDWAAIGSGLGAWWFCTVAWYKACVGSSPLDIATGIWQEAVLVTVSGLYTL